MPDCYQVINGLVTQLLLVLSQSHPVLTYFRPVFDRIHNSAKAREKDNQHERQIEPQTCELIQHLAEKDELDHITSRHSAKTAQS